MKRLIFILAAFIGVQAAAQTPAQQYVEQLKGTDELKEAVWGIKAVKLDGSTMVEHNSRTRMIPASNMKLITTGLALNGLGGDYRFRTGIAYSGEKCNGVLFGDLYIVGGGDPTIGDRDSVAAELKETFSKWEKIVRDAGITRIEGRIVGDGRWFDGESRNWSWMLEDCASGDGTEMSALGFGGGLQSFDVAPGTLPGDPVKVEAVFPEVPWMDWAHSAITAPAGTGDNLYYLTNGLTPTASMTGTLAADAKQKRITCANNFGAMTCAFYFYRYLENQGLIATKGPADIDAAGRIRDFTGEEETSVAAHQDSLAVIGETFSMPLSEIVRHTNSTSNNYYAESILKVLSKIKNGSSSTNACRGMILSGLKGMGVSEAERMQFFDGCGLSRKDYVTPDFFVRFLTGMHSMPEFGHFLSSLPQPGSGTLLTRMASASESVRSRVYMKSGSMNGVRCYSGYILPSDGCEENIIVFSFMTNNTVVAVSRMNFIIDKTVSLLAAEN